MLLLRRALALAWIAVAGVALAGDRTVASRSGSPRGSSSVVAHVLVRVGILPDPQNYFTRVDAIDRSVAESLWNAEVTDIITQHPDFVLWTGDMTDGPGGDENCISPLAWRAIDDPNLAGTPYAAEWTDIRTKGYDRIAAAGIPQMLALGNHDSCIEYERTFPASEWNALTQYSAEADPNLPNACGGQVWDGTCGAGHYSGSSSLPNTANRKALFPTAVGTVCALTMPELAADDDGPWLRSKIGCGSNRPTIVLSHAGTAGLNFWASATAPQKADIILNVWGHFTPNLPADLLTIGTTTNGGVNAVTLFTDQQEQTSGGPGFTNHTGMSYWTLVEIDPVANTIVAKLRNPWLNIIGLPPSPDFTITAGPISLPFNWCSLFGGPQC